MTRRFVVNEHLDVVLEDDGKTHVYVDGKRFIQCMRLILTIPLVVIPAEPESIDEAKLLYGTVLEGKGFEPDMRNVVVEPEVEFVGHCSNLQAWCEHDYDPRLLHSNISFPLLRALSTAGDQKASRVLKASIDERIKEGSSVTRLAIIESCEDLLSDDHLRELVRDTDPNIQHKLAACKRLPGDVIDDLVNNPSIDKHDLSRLIKQENITENALLTIAGRHDEDLLMDLIKRKANSASVWRAIFSQVHRERSGNDHRKDPDWMLRMDIAQHDDLPADVVDTLAADGDWRIRLRVATHHSLQDRVVRQLARDENVQVRKRIAERDDLLFEIVRMLAVDPTIPVRYAVAKRADLPAEIVLNLASDPAEMVKKAIMKREEPTTPEMTLSKASPAFQELFSLLDQRINELDPRVKRGQTPHYYHYSLERTNGSISGHFIEVYIKKRDNRILINLKVGGEVNDPKGITNVIPKEFNKGNLTYIVDFSDSAQIEDITALIDQAIKFTDENG